MSSIEEAAVAPVEPLRKWMKLRVREMECRPDQESYGRELSGEVTAIPSDEQLLVGAQSEEGRRQIAKGIALIEGALKEIEDQIIALAVDDADSATVNVVINESIDDLRNGIRSLQRGANIR